MLEIDLVLRSLFYVEHVLLNDVRPNKRFHCITLIAAIAIIKI